MHISNRKCFKKPGCGPDSYQDRDRSVTLPSEKVNIAMHEKKEAKKVFHNSRQGVPLTAWLFDVDGVLTDPEEKRVTQPEIFDQIIKRLKRREPIGLNTGRSLDFMIEQVLNFLEAKMDAKGDLKNLYAVGEKGGAWITYDDQGSKVVNVDKSITVPEFLQDEVKMLVMQPRFAGTVFFDAGKRTMISVELRYGKTVEEFREVQYHLAIELQNILTRHGLEDMFRIDPTRIAIDIENRQVGKALGARKFAELLEANSIEVQEFIGFGDSSSDYDMFVELKRLGRRARFVFVGGIEHLKGKGLDGVIFTSQLVDKGTLEYLRENEL